MEFNSYNASMHIIDRALISVVRELRQGYPALFVTGPRQSGKTTFARFAFDDLPYVNLESPLERVSFQNDPLGFLEQFPDGAILDEIQNVPEAISYLQVRIDADGRQGRWVLTGSQQPALNREVSQSLAGRVALLELLPFSFAELEHAATRPRTLADAVLRGGYPPLYDADRKLEPVRWLEDYIATFVNRDVRSVLAVRDRNAFDRFLRLCAANSGQVFEAAQVARDIGVDSKTVGHWVSVLEACFLVRLLRPHHRNFGKRLTKRPKLYFLDSGLACRLLQIADVNQLRGHPLWGALAETWCVGEVFKARLNSGLPLDCWFWRSSDGYEVDLVIEVGRRLVPIEIKAGATPYAGHGATIRKLRELADGTRGVEIPPGIIIYGGDEPRPCGADRFVPWRAIDRTIEGLT
jgi:predicted AAA+ superfamily ATPase